MKPAPYGPFPYSPIVRRPRLTWPDGAHVALWVIPNIEFFSLMEKVPAGSGGPGTPVPDIPSWSARDYGNRVGGVRLLPVLRRHRPAQPRSLGPPPRDPRGGSKARLGVDGSLRKQYASPQRSAAGRGKGDHRARVGGDRGRHRGAAGRLAGLGPAGDLGHSRPLGGGRLRICLRLDQRRPALRHEPRRRAAAHLGAL